MFLFDHFDLIAPYYDRVFSRESVPQLTEFVAPTADHCLLDVGGGTGRVAQFFIEHVARVCILDPLGAKPGDHFERGDEERAGPLGDRLDIGHVVPVAVGNEDEIRRHAPDIDRCRLFVRGNEGIEEQRLAGYFD